MSEQENNNGKSNPLKNKWIRGGLLLLLIIAAAGGFLYYQLSSTRINIDKSQIVAPTIDISPTVPGVLEQIFVNEGDTVTAYEPVARVGNEIIKTQVAGLVISANNDIGKTFAVGTPVVSIIDPTQLRVIGTIEENKGLNKISVGQTVSFTVDAFGSKKYEGVVDEISPTSHQSGVVFTISDKRETQLFDIKVRFNPDKYPELKNGMSAKITIYR